MKNDLCNFHREIKLKSFFNINQHTSANKSEDQEKIIKSKFDWEPNKNHHTIQAFIDVAKKDFDKTF